MTGLAPKIRVENGYYHIRIYIGDTLHLHLKKQALLGVQSWRDGEKNYSIEYVMVGGSIVTEYDSAEKWRAILAGLERVI